MVGIMKNINNEYNSSKLNTVDPLNAQKRIDVREIDFII